MCFHFVFFLTLFVVCQSQSLEKRVFRSFRGEKPSSKENLPKQLENLLFESEANKSLELELNHRNQENEIDAILNTAFSENDCGEEDLAVVTFDDESIDNDILEGVLFNGLFDNNLTVRQMGCETEEVCQTIVVPRVGEKRICKDVFLCDTNAETASEFEEETILDSNL